MIRYEHLTQIYMQNRVTGATFPVPSSSGIPVQILELQEHTLGLEWENLEGSSISLEMNTIAPLSSFSTTTCRSSVVTYRLEEDEVIWHGYDLGRKILEMAQRWRRGFWSCRVGGVRIYTRRIFSSFKRVEFMWLKNFKIGMHFACICQKWSNCKNFKK